jgi:hypothetical protein
MGLTLHKRRVRGWKRGVDILFRYALTQKSGLSGKQEKFQLKSKLSRSKSLKLAIGKCSFLPIFLIHCRCWFQKAQESDPFLLRGVEKTGTHGRTYK